jgi:hypothetical protein
MDSRDMEEGGCGPELKYGIWLGKGIGHGGNAVRGGKDVLLVLNRGRKPIEAFWMVALALSATTSDALFLQGPRLFD